jgi:hypothetical protein
MCSYRSSPRNENNTVYTKDIYSRHQGVEEGIKYLYSIRERKKRKPKERVPSN